LHGSPHDLNVLGPSTNLPRFIDFETMCTGPFEWDLAHVDGDVVDAKPGDV
jgi:Ser/Thr protein kinase RdoA (MazF antagonist)